MNSLTDELSSGISQWRERKKFVETGGERGRRENEEKFRRRKTGEERLIKRGENIESSGGEVKIQREN